MIDVVVVFDALGTIWLKFKSIVINEPGLESFCNNNTYTIKRQHILIFYFQFLKTGEDCKYIAQNFERKWNFPYYLRAIDGKHISIVLLPGCGSKSYNYKDQHGMVLMIIVDDQYKFIMCDFGTNGRISDGDVLRNTVFFEKFKHNKLKIPIEKLVRNNSRTLLYVFVADDAFLLKPI